MSLSTNPRGTSTHGSKGGPKAGGHITCSSESRYQLKKQKTPVALRMSPQNVS